MPLRPEIHSRYRGDFFLQRHENESFVLVNGTARFQVSSNETKLLVYCEHCTIFFFLDRFLFLKESWIGKICKIERIGDAVMPVCYFNCFEWKQFRLIGSVKVEI